MSMRDGEWTSVQCYELQQFSVVRRTDHDESVQ